MVAAIAMEKGREPVGNGEAENAVKAPDDESSVYADRVLSAEFATYTKLPDGSTVTNWGSSPAAKGEPVIFARAPMLESSEKAGTSVPLKFAA